MLVPKATCFCSAQQCPVFKENIGEWRELLLSCGGLHSTFQKGLNFFDVNLSKTVEETVKAPLVFIYGHCCPLVCTLIDYLWGLSVINLGGY